ncbi:MAG: hypothetical protein M0024_01485 [Nitrospiraceae bacterium]|nr:hypothetical protein [Nitrospiraceae bacterium]
MANKSKADKVTDADMIFANNMEKIAHDRAEKIYGDQIAKLKQEIENTAHMVQGATMIKVKDADEALARLTKIMALRRMKEALKMEGKWTAFCESNGFDVKKADYEISKVGEVKDEALLKFGVAFGYEINKIKYITGPDSERLGVEVLDGTIVYEGQEIPLAEAPALVEDLKDRLKKEKEERQAEKKTHERRMADEKKHILKLEKEIAKFEKSAREKGLTAEEDAFLQQMENLRTQFDGFYLMNLDPEKMDLTPDSPARMRAALISNLQYLRSQINAAYDTALETFGDPSMFPEEVYRPGTAN